MPADKKGDSGLAARGSMATGDPVRASALHTAAGVELACPACAAAAQGVAARQGPWRVESALIPLTVVALSNVKTQLKPFAGTKTQHQVTVLPSVAHGHTNWLHDF